MKLKKILSLFLVLVMVVSALPFGAVAITTAGDVWDGSVADAFAGGEGTSASPFLISNGAQLAYLAKTVNEGTSYEGAYFKLANDIVLNDLSDFENWGTTAPANVWTPIGGYDSSTDTSYIFSGNLDGAGFAVKGVYFNDANADNVGLFGLIVEAAVSNLKVCNTYLVGNYGIGALSGEVYNSVINGISIENAFINGYANVGGAIGYSSNNTYDNLAVKGATVSGTASYTYAGAVIGSSGDRAINNVTVSGCSVSGPYCVGGLTGDLYYAAVENVTVSDTEISANDNVGGIAGYMYSATVVNSTVAEGVTVTAGCIIGGFAGACSETLLLNCSSAATISANTDYSYNVGGIVGIVCSETDLIKNCCFTGAITACGDYTYDIGGISGSNYGEIRDCYNTGDITANGTTDAYDIGGIVGLSYDSAKLFSVYNVGAVTASGNSVYNIGGVVGCYESVTEYEGCYYLETVGTFDSVVGTELDDDGMRLQSNFAGFDFVNTWSINPEADYPYPILSGGNAQECTHSFYKSYCKLCGIACNHTWDVEAGVCTVCAKYCNHTFDESSLCEICGFACQHDWYDGECYECGAVCTHEWGTDGYCTICSMECAHEFDGNTCTNCGTLCQHYWSNGVCTDCNLQCSHSWDPEYISYCLICDYYCEHSFNEQHICDNCNYECEHLSILENGECEYCGFTCSEHSYENGFCTICRDRCAHSFEDGICTNCGFVEPPSGWNGTIAASFAGGSGTKSDPYQIADGRQLAYLAQSVRGGNDYTYEVEQPEYVVIPYYFVLTADINLNNIPFDSIGVSSENWSESTQFGGCFDGQGYTISNLYTTDQGLFGNIGSYVSEYNGEDNGKIFNLNVIGTVDAAGYNRDVGGIVGRAQGGCIENCSFTGAVNVKLSAYYFYGGIVGEMEGGIINNCIANADVSVAGSQARGVGGILGGAEYNPPSITNCANKGDVYAESALYSAAIASTHNGITNCYNTGNASIFEGWYRGYEDNGVYNSFDASNLQDGITYIHNGENEALSNDALLTSLNNWVDENGSEFTAWKRGSSHPLFVNEEGDKVVIEIFTKSTDASVTSVGEVSLEGTSVAFEVGETVKVKAVFDGTDHRFIGWYANGDFGTVLSNNKNYSFVVTEEMIQGGTYSLTAMYQKNDKKSVTVNGGGSDFTVNGNTYNSEYVKEYDPASVISVSVMDTADFAYWKNINGKIVSYESEYTFTVVDEISLVAVYNKKLENKFTVIFVSDYGQVVRREQLIIAEVDELILPVVPVKTGYGAGDWSHTIDEIANAFNNGVEVLTISPVYPEIVDTATLTVVGGVVSENGEISGEFKLNSALTVVADAAVSGKQFTYWTDQNGNIVSYNQGYAFYLGGNTVLTANYIDSAEMLEKLGTAEITNITKQAFVSGISFVASFSVPEGAKIDFAGIVATSNADKAQNLTAENADYIRGSAQNTTSGRFTWTKSNAGAQNEWFVRAYLVYTDIDGETKTVYSSLASASYENL